MDLSVTAAEPAELTAACRALASDRPAPEQSALVAKYRHLFTSGEIDPGGLFVARDIAGVIRGAMAVQALPGALALAWPPRAVGDVGRAAVEDALTGAGCNWLRRKGIKICQSFAAKSERSAIEPLVRGGFRRVTEVVHLRHEVRGGRADPAGSVLTFDRYATCDRGAFTRSLLETYAGSRDCPELTGDRTADELLDGFANPAGGGDPNWHLVRRDSRPVGVVMLDQVDGAVELSYVGLVPDVRGRGWGDEVMRFVAASAGRVRGAVVTLSVDTRNGPALSLYARHGFREYDRRDVYLASWPGRQSTD